MANCFNWVRRGYELVSAKLEWNAQIPFLQTTVVSGEQISSPIFSSQEIPDSKWKLNLYNRGTKVTIYVWHFNLAGQNVNMVDPVLVKISILNEKGHKVLQKMLPSPLGCKHVELNLTKEEVITSECQKTDGSYTFSCKILSHLKKKPVSSADSPGLAVDCSGGLSTELEELFNEMLFSDVIFSITECEFPAHKSILAARRQVFAAMFQHPTKENLTNKIEIEDIEPEVFKQLLRFVYTGRLKSTTMETMAAGLLIAADKYLLNELKNECEKYLLRHMSPENCVELILSSDLLNPADHLKEAMTEAAKFFRRLPSEVMATAKWEKMEEEDPKKLFQIQKILFSKK